MASTPRWHGCFGALKRGGASDLVLRVRTRVDVVRCLCRVVRFSVWRLKFVYKHLYKQCLFMFVYVCLRDAGRRATLFINRRVYKRLFMFL